MSASSEPAPHVSTPFRGAVGTFQGLEGFDALQPAWASVSAPWASPMLSRAWIRAWAEVYRFERELEFLAAGEGASLAIAPLVRVRRGGLRFEMAGPDSLIESMDFLYQDGTQVPALARALVRSRIPLRFWRVPADSPVVPSLTGAYRHRGLVRRQPAEGCPSLPLDETWARPEDHLDSKGRSNLRRARRIAESMGEVTTEILCPRAEDVGRLLDEAYAVEAAGWKSREGSPLAQDPLLGTFFRRYAAGAAEAGELRLCFLRIGGRAAAMKLAAVTGNRFWLLAMGFSEEFQRCSPGTLLLVETLRYAARASLASYEFLGADEPWVHAWGTSERPCVSIRTYPLGLRGAVALAADASDVFRSETRAARRWVSRAYLKAQKQLALAYSAGPSPEDAVRMAGSLAGMGYKTIIGYMNENHEDARVVARSSTQALSAVRQKKLDCYLSIKAPALRFDRHLVRGIVQAGKRFDARVHFDALAASDVDRTFALVQEMQASHPNLGFTLPARWRRSTADAERAVDLGVSVRVVKGEWAEPRERERNPLGGFLEIVGRIAGRVPHVGVATHNPALARKAVQRLKARGTPCEIEVVRGYPIHRVLPVARSEGVAIRVYVPFGNLAFPYTLGQVARRPRIVLWVTRDIFRGGTSLVPRYREGPSRSHSADSR